ncbi:MAG TPA: MbcA/ParS/Xre antitoxin family protein [Rhizomicrobium sp.]|jgi:uncharacterized protein (DUF2384 family)|nr:MbcA/ParS/Xre antitoxin family protein [Rhizomicrobium sp.]
MTNRQSQGAVTKAGAGAPARLKRAKPRKTVLAAKTTKKSPRQQYAIGPASKQPAQFIVRFFDSNGKVVVKRVAEDFGMSKGQLAETVGLHPEALYKASRTHAPKTQNRVREMLEIVSRVSDWAGSKDQAMAWYRAEPIPAFGGRTAESIVKTGQAAALRDYLDALAMGGFA